MDLVGVMDGVPKRAAAAIAIALTILVMAIDWIAPAALAIPILYLLPVMLATHVLSRQAGFAVAFACGALYLLTSTVSHADDLHPAVALWNCIARTIGLLVVADLQGSLHAALQRERQLARTDGLTGVWNRRHFYELVERELLRLRRYGEPFTIALLDLDDFKQINDRFGHHAGDRCLTRVCEVLREKTRSCDAIGRLGGDEFALLLPCTNSAEAARLVDRVQAKTDGALLQWGASVSIGSATAASGLTTADELIAAADRAMYRAKSAKEAIARER